MIVPPGSDARPEAIESHADQWCGYCPHHRSEHERARRQRSAPVELFDDGYQKNRKRIADP